MAPGESSIDAKPEVDSIITEVVQGRKSWKRSKGERVWPPELETALIEGLQKYEPVDSRETRMLGRFPMRNRFLSDFIFNKTGQLRTAKQVGSRLQQLRDPRSGKRLMSLLSHNMHDPESISRLHNQRSGKGAAAGSVRPPMFSPEYDSSSPPSSPESTSSHSPMTPTDHSPLISSANYRDTCTTDACTFSPSHTLVSIDILPSGIPWSSSDSASASPPPTPTPTSPPPPSNDRIHTFRPSPHPRPLWAIDPTVTFIARSTKSAASLVTVFLDSVVVHTHVSPLEPAGKDPPPDALAQGALLYCTSLAPEYWKFICESEDPTRFTVIQEIYHCPDLSNLSTDNIRRQDMMLFSAVYEFKYPPNISLPPQRPPPSPCSVSAPTMYTGDFVGNGSLPPPSPCSSSSATAMYTGDFVEMMNGSSSDASTAAAADFMFDFTAPDAFISTDDFSGGCHSDYFAELGLGGEDYSAMNTNSSHHLACDSTTTTTTTTTHHGLDIPIPTNGPLTFSSNNFFY